VSGLNPQNNFYLTPCPFPKYTCTSYTPTTTTDQYVVGACTLNSNYDTTALAYNVNLIWIVNVVNYSILRINCGWENGVYKTLTVRQDFVTVSCKILLLLLTWPMSRFLRRLREWINSALINASRGNLETHAQRMSMDSCTMNSAT